MKWIHIALAVALLAIPTLALAHGGGLDSQGGHNDRKAGTYHFHRGPLAGKSFSSKAAATRALAALRESEEEDEAEDPSRVIKRATTSKKIDALIALLIEKKLITEADLAKKIAD